MSREADDRLQEPLIFVDTRGKYGGTRGDRITWSIERFQRDLRLNDWDIRYDPRWSKKDDKHASALTRPSSQHKVAVVRLSPDVTGDNIDFHIAHELTHLMLWDLHQLAGSLAAKNGKAGLAFIDRMEDHVERICNQVAHALSGVLYEPVGALDNKWFAPYIARDVLNNTHEENK
jgi:hypothetical protein